jgi:tRNA-2-methylthio-N6-dimethylallyladenosine synthase
MNNYDSDRLAGLLGQAGYQRVDQAEEADLVLLNTCSVRERAEHKVYSYVGALKELKERRPHLIIGVGGCVAQQEGQRLLDRIPHLDLVFGPGALEQVPELVHDAARGRRRALTPKDSQALPETIRVPADPGLKALVTVMQGCDNFCSYCVVPYLRGRERSRPAGAVLEEVARLVEAGAREVTLLGQNVNSYQDPDTGTGFPNLLQKLSDVEGLWRLRFTTNHPKDLSAGLIEAMAGLPKVMEQIHLPAQSGSDAVLEAMRRGYTRSQYLARVDQLRKRVPGVALGGDMIVGFPGETQPDFGDSLSLLVAVRYDFLYSFKYSDRPFTLARRLPQKVSGEVKDRRLGELQAEQKKISLALHQELVGQKVEVLVEGPAKKGDGLVTGRCRAGRAVNFTGGPDLKGRLVMVEVTEGRVNSLMGRLSQA